jgi:hypothetical protein
VQVLGVRRDPGLHGGFAFVAAYDAALGRPFSLQRDAQPGAQRLREFIE